MSGSSVGQSPAQRGGVSVGLDVGGTKVFGIVVDAAGSVLHEARLATVPGAEGVAATCVAAVTELLDGVGADRAALAGVGIGVPGVVEPATGVVAHAVNLGIDGDGAALAELVSVALDGATVRLDNDLNVAALGASRVLGTGDDLAFLALGTGVAAGLVLDGRLRHGLRGAAGEIGHIPVGPGGSVCACGQRGCLETVASGSALAARWPVAGGASAALDLFAAAAAGRADAVAVRAEYADAVAAAVRILVLTCDVHRVVLGGGVAAVGEPLREAVAAALRRQAEGSEFLTSLRMDERVEVVRADLPVAAIGAAALVMASG